jgi:predicted adenine nucleotide alpha hydrolase (AANH) superfamily ATPase
MKDIGEARCHKCYTLRLEKAAKYAVENGFDAFTTSLLVSPYQKHDLIKELGDHYASEYGVEFIYRDFRPGFRQGQQMAKDMGLYRQKYCGCILSLT